MDAMVLSWEYAWKSLDRWCPGNGSLAKPCQANFTTKHGDSMGIDPEWNEM